jgi:tetratricopeptide (TPR) repeat protein
MRHPYRNLFGSCLLAALILPSQNLSAAPLQDSSTGLRTDWSTSSRPVADRGLAGIQTQRGSVGNAADGLQEGIDTGSVTGPGREPILGRLPRPGAALAAGPAASAGPSNTPQLAPISTPPGSGVPGGVTTATPPPPSEATGTSAPSSGFSAPRPVMPQALADALTALGQKKADDAVRLARTFISQADAKGPGPENTPPLMALAHEIVGTGLAVQGKQDEAIAELQKALSINPNQNSAQFKLGVVYREQNRLPEAKAALEKAVAMGGAEPVKLYLGDVNEHMGDIAGAIQVYEPLLSGPRGEDLKFKVHLATLYDRVNRFADAIKLLQPLVTVESKDPEALMALGFAYGGSGKPKEAIPLMLAAKALNPDSWRLDLALGTAQREVGEFDAAEASLKRVVAVEPKQVQARFQLALAQMGKSQFPDAVATLKEGVKLAPNSVELKQVLGDALFRAGQKDEAVAQFKELAARDGAGLTDAVNLGRVYQATGRLDDAEQTYRQALQKFPPNPAVYALLSTVQTEQKNFPAARETIATGRKVTPDDPRLLRALIQTEIASGSVKAALPVAQRLVDVQPKSLEDRFGLASIYGRLGDRKNAIATYRALLADAPDSPVVLNNLASALTDDGDAKGALPLAKRAQELQPKSAATNDTLGWALLKSGQTKDALPLFETATQLDPTNPELLYHLGMAQKASNNPKAARANLEKALTMSADFTGHADARAALAALPK